jgi:CHAT domain-containing protein
MMAITEAEVLALLRDGTTEQRVEFVEALPPNGFKDQAKALVGGHNPGMIVVALASMIQSYCYGQEPEVGAVLASATHTRAVDIWENEPDHGLLPTTLSGLATSHLKALSLMGRSEELVAASDRYIRFYKKLGEHQNLLTIRVLQIEALVNLRRIDDAARELENKSLFADPIAGIEARRLKGWVDMYRKDPTSLQTDAPQAPEPPDAESLVAAIKTAVSLGFDGAMGEKMRRLVDGLNTGNRIDTGDAGQFGQLLDALDKGEQFLRRGGENSEIAVRGRIRNASAIFVHGTPPADRIRRSLAELNECLEWARVHKVVELVNDALWGLYLCHSRLEQPSEAADALIGLRGSLEAMRAGIADPMKRGGVFGAYRYLFNALCEKLHQAGRFEDLLEAIESSKGRVIADKLTQKGTVVPDAAIYGCAARLPEIAQREGFHYLTYFVDEDCVYAVMVSKHGQIYGLDPVRIPRKELREASRSVNPERWGQPKFHPPGARHPNASEVLRPLTAWLEKKLADGVVRDGDHICYASDDDFHNVPLHYLRFGDGILLDRFSVSRVHSAFHLDLLMQRPAVGAPDRYLGVLVPLKQDLERPDGDQSMLASMAAPIEWLEAQGLAGQSIRMTDATPARCKNADLAGAIIHFSTHGWFRPEENPFYKAYLLLADGKGLPDLDRVTVSDYEGKLPPRDIVAAELDFSGSHVSMMACLSGLAREGVAGDILGLDWAMIQLGARSIISAHWEVSAACAAKFFEYFYTGWVQDGKPRAAAWRDAILTLIDGDHSPLALERWSAFSLTGDFR